MENPNKDIEDFLRENPIDNNGNPIDSSNDSAYESVSGICKRRGYLIQNRPKIEIIREIASLNYRTPPRILAGLLDNLFSSINTHEGHWLFIAQHWTPKAIKSVINEMLRRHRTGEVTIKSPPAYFTYLIKFHPKRKKFSKTNGT